MDFLKLNLKLRLIFTPTSKKIILVPKMGFSAVKIICDRIYNQKCGCWRLAKRLLTTKKSGSIFATANPSQRGLQILVINIYFYILLKVESLFQMWLQKFVTTTCRISCKADTTRDMLLVANPVVKLDAKWLQTHKLQYILFLNQGFIKFVFISWQNYWELLNLMLFRGHRNWMQNAIKVAWLI